MEELLAKQSLHDEKATKAMSDQVNLWFAEFFTEIT
jgi:hypothetical protein